MKRRRDKFSAYKCACTPRRDAPSRATLDGLLATWTKTGNGDTGLVAADALRASGYVDAADDLDYSLKNFDWARHKTGLYYRRSLIKRIRSEIDRGRALVRGKWSEGPNAHKSYLAIFEEPKQRVLLWERFDKIGGYGGRGGWGVWGTYNLKDFDGDMRELMRLVNSDIRYESLPFQVRAAQRQQRAALLKGQ